MMSKVVCTYPSCCREIALRQFKNHFVACHLRDDEDYTDETRAKYSHDADDCRIAVGSFARRSRERAPKSMCRHAKAEVKDVRELKKGLDKLAKDLQTLTAAVLANKGVGASATATSPATVVADPEGCDRGYASDSSDSSTTAPPNGKSPLIDIHGVAGPIGKTAPVDRGSSTKRRLEDEGEESDESDSSMTTSTPNGKAVPLNRLELAGPSTRSIDGAAHVGGRANKKRRVERKETAESSTSKVEVVMTIMSLDGVPDVSRELRGSRKKANNAVHKAWKDATDAGVPCKLQCDELGYCLLTIRNADGTVDTIEARRIPKYKTLFAPRPDD